MSQGPYYAAGTPYSPGIPANTPLPPKLHWVLVLLFSWFTGGLFGWVWLIVQASWVKKATGIGGPLVAASLGFCSFLLYFVLIVGALASNSMNGVVPFAGLFSIAGVVLVLVAAFKIKATLERFLNRSLSGVMTFFFNVLYLQYHMSYLAQYLQAAQYQAPLQGYPPNYQGYGGPPQGVAPPQYGNQPPYGNPPQYGNPQQPYQQGWPSQNDPNRQP